MPIQSDRDGECYDCGKKWQEGTEISANGHKTKKGKDYWCVDGANCKGAMQISGNPKPKVNADPQASRQDPTPKQYLLLAKKLMSGDPTYGAKDEFISNTTTETKWKVVHYLIQRAEIESTMNELGLEHPGRRGFIEDVLK